MDGRVFIGRLTIGIFGTSLMILELWLLLFLSRVMDTLPNETAVEFATSEVAMAVTVLTGVLAIAGTGALMLYLVCKVK